MAADDRDSDMSHRRIRLSSMPVALTCLDVYDIAYGYLALLSVGSDHALPEVTTRIWSQL